MPSSAAGGRGEPGRGCLSKTRCFCMGRGIHGQSSSSVSLESHWVWRRSRNPWRGRPAGRPRTAGGETILLLEEKQNSRGGEEPSSRGREAEPAVEKDHPLLEEKQNPQWRRTILSWKRSRTRSGEGPSSLLEEKQNPQWRRTILSSKRSRTPFREGSAVTQRRSG